MIFNSHFGDSIKVKIDLSNYATKADIKNISHVDSLSFALKTNLANLKTEVDKLYIDKLNPLPLDLSKLSDVVNNVVKKSLYNKLVAKADNIDSSNFDFEKTKLENKIHDTSGFVKKTNYNTKITELENKTPDTSGFVKNIIILKLQN